MTQRPVRISPAWLALREPADAAARSRDLVAALRRGLLAAPALRIYDLGCGTGSMTRWLVPQLTGAQHWVLFDRDPDLLGCAAAAMPAASADGAPITLETRERDITRLQAVDLAGASLITASALLDMLSADELERLVTSCVEASCPALVTISVTGTAQLTPDDPFDRPIQAAFNDHQCRSTHGRKLLGPDAVAVAANAFTRHGAHVHLRASPWRLGPSQSALTTEWLAGWVGAALDQRPELAVAARDYLRRRHADLRAGRLSVTVDHQDLLAEPSRPRSRL
jgi:SAM-dependent methyltransferase